jgi:hypothetical protein
MTNLRYTISTAVLAAVSGTITRTLSREGYSGHGEGLNNPALCDVPDVGPLPCGAYTLDAPIEPPGHLGPLAFPLIPDAANEMHGRDGFYMHGDNAEMNHTASDGCIILPRVVRAAVAMLLQSGPVRLTVVSA